MNCTTCGASDFRLSYSFGDRSYMVCRKFSSASFHPVPSLDEINEFYQNYVTYKSGLTEYMTDASYPGFVTNLELTMTDLGHPFSNSSKAKLIDIGCGNGFFLQYIKEKFPLIEARGMDLSQECVEKCKFKGLNVSLGDVFSIDQHAQFDFITLFHVIEHVTHPLEWLKRIYELLKPNGVFIIETPVFGPVAEAFGASWRYFMPVEHLCLFSTDALISNLGQQGFEIISKVTYGSGNNIPDISPGNKRAMDRMVKKLGIGDTFAVQAKKRI
jgi:2-polyprenyl-3-methyl-5-hydroxy-6-metoxy-1,4-benzoquinol methylase